MHRKIYVVGGALLAAVILFTVSVNLWGRIHSKTPYIELHKVFSEYEMSKQYKKKLDAIVLSRNNILDSMELQLNASSRLLKGQVNPAKDKVELFLYEKEAYLRKREQFEEDNAALERQYNAEISKQLNQYIKDYGEKKCYDYIYGAEGSGTIMYADKSLNITEQVITYVNERYHGNKK